MATAAFCAKEMTIGLISSAPWKRLDFMTGLPLVDPRLVPTTVEVARGVREVETVSPDECAQGKLASFIRWTDALSVLERANAGAGAVVDVLFTLNLHAFTTDRAKNGAMPTLKEMMEWIKPESSGCRPVTLNVWNTSGTARIKDLRESWKNLSPESVLVSKDRLLMTLSPGVIALLSDQKQLKKLHQRRLMSDSVFTSRSVGGFDWVGFLPLLPKICAELKDDLWMGIDGAGQQYVLDDQLARGDIQSVREVELATELLRRYAKGVPQTVLAGMRELIN
jgi:hypothetical protein